ncbi:hypothetical protein D3C73_1545250 [compost metagenome]
MISHTSTRKTRPRTGGNTVRKKGRKDNLLPFALDLMATLAGAAAFCMTCSAFPLSAGALTGAFSTAGIIALMMFP